MGLRCRQRRARYSTVWALLWRPRSCTVLEFSLAPSSADAARPPALREQLSLLSASCSLSGEREHDVLIGSSQPTSMSPSLVWAGCRTNDDLAHIDVIGL